MSEKEGGISKLFDILAKIGAIAVLLAMGFETIVALIVKFGGTIDPDVLSGIANVVNYILTFGALGLAGLVALEFGTKHNFIIFIIVVVIIALVIIPRFFPDLWAELEAAIPEA